MKIYLLSAPLIAILLLIGHFNNDSISEKIDSNISQCHNTTQAFAELANDDDFGSIHLNPVSFDLAEPKGSMVLYELVDGSTANAYFIPSKKKSDDYLFVIHEWYGLNDFVKSQSDLFSGKFEGMNIIALDLYDGKVADNREDAGKYMQAVQTKRALSIIKGAQHFVGTKANIYTVGWCFGGGWSLQSAIEVGNQAKGAIMFYGMPEGDMSRLSTLKCDVLGIFASQDKWINQKVAADFDAKMAKLPNKLTLKMYDADHGFANPSNPIYDETAAADAYKEMANFIASRR